MTKQVQILKIQMPKVIILTLSTVPFSFFVTHFTYISHIIMKTRPNLQILKSNNSFLQDNKENFLVWEDPLDSASTSTSMKKKKWRRKRKNHSQVTVLIEEYNRSAVWTKEQVVSLAEQTGLSEAQVYKWGWDYKKKLRKQAMQFNVAEVMCGEILAPSKIDLEMVELQKRYKELYSSLNFIVPAQLF